MSAFTREQAKPTLVMLGKHESGNSYTIVYMGIPKSQRPSDLRTMTINQVLDWQKKVVSAGSPSSAAGYYQVIRATLQSSYSPAGLTLSSLFDEFGQDRIGMYLLGGRGFQKYLDGLMSEDNMMIGLAKEWASMPVPYDMMGASRWVTKGQSYYAGDGLNKAGATVDEVRTALQQSLFLYKGTKPKERPVLRMGDKGKDVTDLQVLLESHGLYIGPKVDGDFGISTDAAVRYFQSVKRLSPIDGVVGSDTWEELEKDE